MSFHTATILSCDKCNKNYAHAHWSKKALRKAAALAGWVVSFRIAVCPDCDVF